MVNYTILWATFSAGFGIMAVEMTASRMLQNIYSASNIIWACIIASVLLCSAIGNWLGGFLSDRRNKRLHALSPFLSLSGFFILLIPVVAQPMLMVAARAMDEARTSVAGFFFILTLLSLSPAVILMSAITPYCLSFSHEENKGAQNGICLAMSTIGSIFGALTPVFWFIPAWGSYRTFLAISIFFFLSTIFLNWRFFSNPFGFTKWKILPLVGLGLSLFTLFQFSWKVKNSTGQLIETESMYNYIEVLEDQNQFRLLRLNEGQGIQSVYKPTVENYFGPWEQILSGVYYYPQENPLQPNVKEAAILGLAGGTAAKALLLVFPEVKIDGYEIDEEIIKISRKYFDLDNQRLVIHVKDGRSGLLSSQKMYDIIMIDAYTAPYIAPHMCTLEFFSGAFKRLSEQGSLVINVGHSNNNKNLLNALYATVSQIFPSVYITDIPNAYNSVIIATRSKTFFSTLEANLNELDKLSDPNHLLNTTIRITLNHTVKNPDRNEGLILTDDFCPVEKLTDEFVFDYLLRKEENHEKNR